MAAIDDFSGYGPQLDGPATHAAAVTPDDANDLSHVCRALWIGVGGNITVITLGGETVVHTVPAGARLDLQCTRVKATGTTATGIVAWW